MATGDYIVFLNNDTVVTGDWLYSLTRLLHSHTRLGMIGPVSNQVGNVQKIQVAYKETADMHRWAQDYTRQQDDDYRAVNMLGFSV
jgi:GT2 family glycosyltransferase